MQEIVISNVRDCEDVELLDLINKLLILHS